MDKNREIIEEKDERIAHLERQLIELREAHQQSAAAIAVNHNSRSFSPQKGTFKFFLKVGGLKFVLAILGLLVISIGGIWLFTGSNSKQESVTIIEHVQELATLATAQAHTSAILHEKDNKIFGKDISKNLPGTKRELLLIVPGTVIAGVDLKRVTTEDLVINEETNEIDITLPHAKLLQKPSLQMDKIQTYDNVGLFRSDIKWEEGFDLGAKAQEQIRKDVLSNGLLNTAEKNAETVLKEFFKKMDYTVNVTFK